MNIPEKTFQLSFSISVNKMSMPALLLETSLHSARFTYLITKNNALAHCQQIDKNSMLYSAGLVS
ncbi:hypothetical protein [Noviherbaspirillum pedocola]|uniref:Uncharacterized protein n=1 Tax=Noviherbaspirillum pedocola TaxID=2801341 RepID=A0A934SRS4_9BURK|nr:hypothetical protein [Noviherbaspirillum pedocola]MBK4734300.1 hypothetical protein [Noviherbaspirillum pedocola]